MPERLIHSRPEPGQTIGQFEQTWKRASVATGPHFSMTIAETNQQLRRLAAKQVGAGKMSVKLLAHLTSSKPPTISNWLRRNRGVSVPMLSRLAQAIGWDVELMPRHGANRSGQEAAPRDTARA